MKSLIVDKTKPSLASAFTNLAVAKINQLLDRFAPALIDKHLKGTSMRFMFEYRTPSSAMDTIVLDAVSLKAGMAAAKLMLAEHPEFKTRPGVEPVILSGSEVDPNIVRLTPRLDQ